MRGGSQLVPHPTLEDTTSGTGMIVSGNAQLRPG